MFLVLQTFGLSHSVRSCGRRGNYRGPDVFRCPTRIELSLWSLVSLLWVCTYIERCK